MEVQLMRLVYRTWSLLLIIAAAVLLSSCTNSVADLVSTPTQSDQTQSTTITPAFWPTEGWRFSSPEEQGLDGIKLEEMSRYIRENIPTARSILVIRNGYIVYEDYFKGDETFASPIWSVTKSVLSALVGIAIEEGLISGIDEKLVAYLDEHVDDRIDPLFNEIKLEHLLTMTAGFPYDQRGSSNISAAFRVRIENVPGAEANYNSTSTHLLSAVLTKATGVTALEYANDRLFSPLGIYSPRWDADVDGINLGGYGIYLTPRDMARIGYLYLMEGNWEGQQIVPRRWVQTSTVKQAEAGIPGLSEHAGYGYLWWTRPMGKFQAYAAYGAGGQMIAVIPGAELIIIATTDSNQSTEMTDMATQYVIPAIID
jgi:CubicO group peptidase (beta-lactamase class C family)